MSGLPFLDGDTVAALDPAAAVAALRSALAAGLDPAVDPPRSAAPMAAGELLLMPADGPVYAGVKITSVAPANPAAGRPRIQGIYLLLDAATLTPVALLDAIALTSVRTAAVSALAASLLADEAAQRLVVFGTGPQAHAHMAALCAVRPIRDVVVVGRSAQGVQRFVDAWSGRLPSLSVSGIDRSALGERLAAADVVVCATTASSALFAADALADSALAIAVGSHQAGVVELDPALLGRAQVVVENPATALREAGEVVAAVAAGVLDPEDLIGLDALVRGVVAVDASRPRVFKSVGMAWEDRVVAEAVLARQLDLPELSEARADVSAVSG